MSNQKYILVIDDDPRNIFAITAVLKSRGYKVIAASQMAEAFTLLDEQAVGIILMDMMMPDMDGYEAIPLLKKDPRYQSIPVISVTAQAMPGDKEKSMAAGADGYVSKPVDIDLLTNIIHEHMN